MTRDENILIFGAKDDYQSLYMYNQLLKYDVSPYLIDTVNFPHMFAFSFDVKNPSEGYIKFLDTGKKIDFDAIKGSYIRIYKGVAYTKENDPLLREVVYWNNDSSLVSLLKIINCNWVNSLDSVINHRYKPLQLQVMMQNGINIPKTIITNDPEEVRKVWNNGEQKIIYKPVRGWANTAIMTSNDMTENKLSLLKFSPITMQSCILGQDIRVYVVGDYVFPVGIDSKEIDSRASDNNKHYPVEIPDEVMEMCKKVAKLLGFVYTAIDMKKTLDGEYFVLEANATPIFVNDEKSCGYPISEKICELLLK